MDTDDLEPQQQKPALKDDQPIISIRAIPDRDALIKLLLPVWRKAKMDRKGYFAE